jgi:hypothetical protein
MINIGVYEITDDDGNVELLSIAVGGNNEPSININIPPYQYEDTMKTIVDNLLSSRSFVWESKKPKDQTDAEIDRKEKNKIISLEKTIKKD